MRPYIEKIVDVIGDGNCGFRAIAESMGLTVPNIRTLSQSLTPFVISVRHIK